MILGQSQGKHELNCQHGLNKLNKLSQSSSPFSSSLRALNQQPLFVHLLLWTPFWESWSTRGPSLLVSHVAGQMRWPLVSSSVNKLFAFSSKTYKIHDFLASSTSSKVDLDIFWSAGVAHMFFSMAGFQDEDVTDDVTSGNAVDISKPQGSAPGFLRTSKPRGRALCQATFRWWHPIVPQHSWASSCPALQPRRPQHSRTQRKYHTCNVTFTYTYTFYKQKFKSKRWNSHRPAKAAEN